MIAGLYFFVAHSLTSANPMVDLRLMRDRNYALGMLLVFLYGVLTLAPMVLMPPFLQDLQDYPIATIGLLLSPRGLGLFVAMMMLARVGRAIDFRLQIARGLPAARRARAGGCRAGTSRSAPPRCSGPA